MKVSEVIKPELVKLDLKPGSKESALEALTIYCLNRECSPTNRHF